MADTTKRSARRLRVLVVDDAELSRDLLQQMLEDRHEVRVAVDGGSGLSATRAWRPHVVLLDLALPGMDGWAVARAIRADPALAGVHVVALTAYAMPGDRETAVAAGCEAYLTKPIDETALFAVLDELARSPDLSP